MKTDRRWSRIRWGCPNCGYRIDTSFILEVEKEIERRKQLKLKRMKKKRMKK